VAKGKKGPLPTKLSMFADVSKKFWGPSFSQKSEEVQKDILKRCGCLGAQTLRQLPASMAC